jgi:hypothetical protein
VNRSHAKQGTSSYRYRAPLITLGVVGLVGAGFATAGAVHAATSTSPGNVQIPFNDVVSALNAEGYNVVAQAGASTTTAAPTPTTQATTPTTSSFSTLSTSLNSVARIGYSMNGPHEGQMQGVPTSWSWGSHPEVDNPVPNPTSRFDWSTAWGQVYPDANATEAAQGSVRVEVKHMEEFVYSASQHKWLRVQGTVGVGGAWFVDNWSSSRTPDWRTEADGGVSVSMPTDGEFFHFWPSSGRGQLPIAPSDVAAVYTTYQARLIGTNAANAKFLANVGADWWVNATSPNNGVTGPTGNNEQVGEGRFMYLSSNWSAIDFYSGGTYGPAAYPPAWGASQLASSNPPIDAMGLP